MNLLDNLIWIALILVSLYIATTLQKKYVKANRIRKLAQSGITDIDRMDGYQFEVYLMALFKKLGYNSVVTKKAGDFGADIVLKGKNKVVIQAKRYRYKNKVSIGAIQEIYAAKAYYDASEAWVVTNSQYTKKAKELALACNVKLFDRVELVNLINKVNPDVSPNDILNTVEPAPRKCPKCKQALVLRNGKLNRSFFGCTQYPTCTHTEPV